MNGGGQARPPLGGDVGVHSSGRLHPDDVEAIADAVARRLTDGGGPVFVDAATLAARFSLSRSWVYEHADELGAVRVGDGPRAGVRFEVEVAAAALRSRQSSGRSEAADSVPVLGDRRSRRRTPSASAHSGARTTSAGAPLLPVRGERA